MIREMLSRPWMKLLTPIGQCENRLIYESELFRLQNAMQEERITLEQYHEQRSKLDREVSELSFSILVCNLPTFLRWLKTVRRHLSQIFHCKVKQVALFLHAEFETDSEKDIFRVYFRYRSLSERQKVFVAALSALREIPV
jgi:hypothetical protein